MFGSGKKSRKNKMFSEDAAAQLDSLYTTALRLTGQPAEAEDLVHDTFVRALRFRHRFEPGTNLRAWLFKMMVNLFTNNYRRQRRGQDISHGAEQQALLERNYARQKLHASEQPEEFFFEKLFSQDVVQAIEQLPLDFRLVVLLVDIEEFSYAQVASILDIPVGTVMSRLHRGRKLLRSALYEFALEEGYIKETTQKREQDNTTDLQAYRRRKKSGT